MKLFYFLCLCHFLPSQLSNILPIQQKKETADRAASLGTLSDDRNVFSDVSRDLHSEETFQPTPETSSSPLE
mgnify:CR=1 FL=1